MNRTNDTAELLDHEYDGIREYDNPTPGWWHILFLLSVLFCFPYIVMWHFSPIFASIHEQYDEDVAAYYRAQFAKFGELTPDEATLAGLAANPNYMAAVAGTFQAKCASCHAKDGGGLVGPNLVDDHWVNVKKIEDIHRVIRDGVVAKGMPAWGRQLRDVELVLLSAYVASLRGSALVSSIPPEGEPIPPWPAHEMLDFDQDETDIGS